MGDYWFSSRDCLRDLIMKVTRNQILPKLCHLEWTTELIDVLRELLDRGADPSWIPQGYTKSAVFAFLLEVFPILAQMKKPLALELEKLLSFFLTEKYFKDREKQHILEALLEALLTKNLFKRMGDDADLFKKFREMLSFVASSDTKNAEDKNYRTVLHLMAIKSFKLDPKALQNLLSIIDLLKSPENVNKQDEYGETPLHHLARGLLEHTTEISEPLSSLFSLLLTPQNLNCEDKYSVTPYSWILVGKERWKDDDSKQTLFLKIEKIFMENGADAEKARSAVTVPILRWMENEFKEVKCKWTEKRLERLLGCMEAVANWEPHTYLLQLNDQAIWNLQDIKNTRWTAIVMKIMRVISKNKTIAENIWNNLMFYYVEKNFGHFRLHIMEILSICAEAGAQSTGKQAHIIKWVKEFTRNGELAEPYLKVLVSSDNEKRDMGKFDLSFLAEFYEVPQKLVQVANNLVRLMYDKLDECEAARQLIKSFNDDNWMKRSQLHLAVIFLDSLELLSDEIIEKYIEARDVHGCTPLHLAYLHQKENTVKFLRSYVKNENATDHFGLTPSSMSSSIGDKIKNKYYEDCQKVLQAKTKVMELLKPMMVMPEDEVQDLSNELQKLFESLVSKNSIFKGEIQIAGSMREMTKSGLPDQADIQILLKGMDSLHDQKKQNEFVENCSLALGKALAKISWEGIHLRPIDISGPWKFIWEGNGRGMQISLDVVLVVNYEETDKNEKDNYIDIDQRRQKILQAGPQHEPRGFITLENWTSRKSFKMTMFEYEWDIIDSLPMHCRLSLVITKSLLQVSIFSFPMSPLW